jgi:hypothetical protein
MNVNVLYFPTTLLGNSTANADVLVEYLSDSLVVQSSVIMKLDSNSTLNVSFLLPGFYNFKFVNVSLYGTGGNKLGYLLNTPVNLSINDQLLDVVSFQAGYEIFNPSSTYGNVNTSFVYRGDNKRYLYTPSPTLQYSPSTFSISPWLPNTSYNVNDVVYTSNLKIYRCITAHTSGTTIDLTKFNLVLLTDAMFSGLFSPDGNPDVFVHNLGTTNFVFQVYDENHKMIPTPTNTIDSTQISLSGLGLQPVGNFRVVLFYRSNTIV